MITGGELKPALRTERSQEKLGKQYSQVKEAIANYNKAISASRLPLSVSQLADLGGKLDEVREAAKQYQGTFPNSKTIKALLANLDGERHLLIETSKDRSFADRTLNNGRGFTVQQAMELKRFGVTPGPKVTFDETHTDDNVKKTNEKFASGNLSTVAKITYKDGVTKILKAEPEDRGNAVFAQKVGIDKNKPHYANRNIATKVVDNFLKTDLATSAQFAIHNGRLCLSMDFAPGVLGHGALAKKPLDPNNPTDVQEASRISQMLSAPDLYSDEDIQSYCKDNHIEWDKVTGELFRKYHVPYDINYKNPELARAMANSELIDYITGQGDRHPGNYLIDMRHDGSFKGSKLIDSDQAFGSDLADPEEHYAKLGQGGGTLTTSAYKGIGMPLLFDKASVDELRAPGAWAKLEADLKGLLTPDELKAAKSRFDKLVAHVGDPANSRFVITDWSARTLPPGGGSFDRRTPAQFLLDHPDKSYLGRDFRVQQDKIRLDGLKPAELPG